VPIISVYQLVRHIMTYDYNLLIHVSEFFSRDIDVDAVSRVGLPTHDKVNDFLSRSPGLSCCLTLHILPLTVAARLHRAQ
jgi:hypothetical protein